MNRTIMDKCSHGRPFYGQDTECRECEIIWHKEMLAKAEKAVARHKETLAVLCATDTDASQTKENLEQTPPPKPEQMGLLEASA